MTAEEARAARKQRRLGAVPTYWTRIICFLVIQSRAQLARGIILSMLIITWRRDGSCHLLLTGDFPAESHVRPLPDEPPHQFTARISYAIEKLRATTDPPLTVTHQAE